MELRAHYCERRNGACGRDENDGDRTRPTAADSRLAHSWNIGKKHAGKEGEEPEEEIEVVTRSAVFAPCKMTWKV